MPAPLAIMLALTAPTPAPGPADGGPDVLAATLGRAHALHRLCAGPADDLWRGRMQAMLVVEHATPAQRGRLVTRFNAGYAEAAAQFTACTPASRQALTTTMAQGRTQAAGLAAGSSSTP